MSSWRSLGEHEPAGGRLLVSTPALGDPNFARSVVYLLEHDDDGTVGVILNRPSRTPVGQVLPQWHEAVIGPPVVFAGGPVQPDGALCLAQLDSDGPGARRLVDGIGTVDLDGDLAVATSMARRLRVFAGHSGWSPGQLADEMAEGAWWVVPGNADDLFSAEPAGMWAAVLRRQRSPLNLVSTFPPDVALN
ncbi:MAG: YqgE/AlgH family protein [Actinomycetota bacterium]|nr:YqgE/AlgH family protein [Actinomycetota bacterium]